MNASQPDTKLDELARNYRDGFSLASGFYKDPSVYTVDLDRVIFRSWTFAGHISELTCAGAYFLFEIGMESVIVVRQVDGEIRAFGNVCRHRGSRICDSQSGVVKMFVCPYHVWSYNIDGSLRGMKGESPGSNEKDYRLRPVRLQLVEGLIFVQINSNGPSFREAAEEVSTYLAPYKLSDAKVAHKDVFRVEANWKLCVENFFECYHCSNGHPEYARSHVNASPDGYLTKMLEDQIERRKSLGLAHHSVAKYGSPLSAGQQNYRINPWVLKRGYRTGSQNGGQLAPRLGGLEDLYGGYTSLLIGPTSFFILYSDYLVCFRFSPKGVNLTDMEVCWLVDESAQEGRNYNVADLVWLWTLTTEQDTGLIERNQKGVNSMMYEPGPYTSTEGLVREFVNWYVGAIKYSGEPGTT